MQNQKSQCFAFHKLVNQNVQTLTDLNGEIYLSANDLCKFLERMSFISDKMVKTAPNPVIGLQVQTISDSFRTVQEAIRSKAKCEKSKQPSAN